MTAAFFHAVACGGQRVTFSRLFSFWQQFEQTVQARGDRLPVCVHAGENRLEFPVHSCAPLNSLDPVRIAHLPADAGMLLFCQMAVRFGLRPCQIFMAAAPIPLPTGMATPTA